MTLVTKLGLNTRTRTRLILDLVLVLKSQVPYCNPYPENCGVWSIIKSV